jgi:hypothetical protein
MVKRGGGRTAAQKAASRRNLEAARKRRAALGRISANKRVQFGLPLGKKQQKERDTSTFAGGTAGRRMIAKARGKKKGPTFGMALKGKRAK